MTDKKILLFIKFAFNVNLLIMSNLNRIKGALADAGRTNKWLAEQLGKDPVTVSKWCTNTSQPDLQTLSKISVLLNVDIRQLLTSNSEELAGNVSSSIAK